MDSTHHHDSGLREWKLVSLIVGLSLFYFIQLFYFGGFNEETNRQAIRISARIAVVLFSMAFIASSFQYFVKNVFSFWLLMNRKFIGISFAILHLIHLAFLLLLQQNFHPVFNKAKTISLIGGGMAYVFLVLMLLTSFSAFSKYLSKKQWTALHTVGGIWIWYIFARSYFKRVDTEIEYLPIVVLLAIVIIFRIARVVSKGRKNKISNK